MNARRDTPRDTPDGLTEFAAELRLLAETVLERVEPVLRHAAAGGTEWSNCQWCPVCAAAAIVRGEHHEVVAVLAEHGTAIVTVLREALAGVPVEPVGSDHAGAPGEKPAEDHGPDDTPDATPESGSARRRREAAGRPERSRYVDIPVTIKG